MTQSRKLGIIMDPIGSIIPRKDSSLAMLLAAQARDWELFYMEAADLRLKDDHVQADARPLTVFDTATCWYATRTSRVINLDALDVILMRVDPPVDMEYIYTTALLDLVEAAGTLVVNRPSALRDFNEKLATAWFAECSPPQIVSRCVADFREFLDHHGDIIVKPLDRMGGGSIYRVRAGETNAGVIFEDLTANGNKLAVAQLFLPEIRNGDKRILLIDGEPVPYALARIPAPGENRGNLAAGGLGKGVALSSRDRWICDQVGPTLRELGILFAGIDVIGDWLTEINITSPTCIRELETLYDLDIAGQLLDAIETRL